MKTHALTSQINFGELKVKFNALKRLAILTNGNNDTKAQEAYTKLRKISDKQDITLLLELYNETGSKVSKLGPLEEDTVEISCSSDFTDGIEQAIDKLEDTQDIKNNFFFDTARQRILSQMKNLE